MWPISRALRPRSDGRVEEVETTKTMTLARCALLLLLLPLAGCGSLRDDVSREWWVADEPSAPFLGVVVSFDPRGTGGALVDRVLRESPAAAMGIAPGDSIVRYGALGVGNPAALRSAMRRVHPYHSTVEVTVQRGDQELLLSGAITYQHAYAEKASAALDAAEQKGQTRFPFLFRFSDWHIDADVWAAWTGSTPSEPVVGYSETTILPVLEGIVSLFRYESTDCLEDRSRVMFVAFPLVFSSSDGDEEARRGEIGAARPSERL